MPSRPVLRRLVAASCCLLVLAGVSTALGATATDCRTGVRLDGTWQRLTRPQFPTPPGVQTQGLAVAYAVDPRAPFRIVITDGTSVLASDDAGCSWAAVLVLAAEPSAELPLSGRTSRIVGLVVTDDSHPLAVLRDASVSPARPRVMVGTPGRNGRWRLREQGLPAAGEPGVVAAGPGAVAYLAVTPPPEVPAATSPLPAPVPLPAPDLPALPGGPAAPQPRPAALYSLPPQGAWRAGVAAADLPGGRVEALATDPADARSLWLASGGVLLRSRDGGASTAPVPQAGLSGVTALASRARGVVAFGNGPDGPALADTRDAGRTWRRTPAPATRSAAVRADRPDAVLVQTSAGRLRVLDASTGRSRDVTPAAGSGPVTADLSSAPTWHALGADLLRFVDPAGPGRGPVAVQGLDGPGAPVGAVLEPAQARLRLFPGTTGTTRQVLAVPPTPTPVDLMLLLDVSRSMTPVLEEFRAGTRALLAGLQADGIDVQVGLAVAGTAPADGSPDPPTDPTRPGYRQPQPYQLLRAIGPPDADFFTQLAGLGPETVSFTQQAAARSQGQLLALDQLLSGRGVRSKGVSGAPVYDVPPGQSAGWRPSDRIRRVLVDATDQGLRDTPYGTPIDGSGRADRGGVITALQQQRVVHVGLSNGTDPAAVADLAALSRASRGVAPAGGLDCDGDGRIDLAAGAPLVCTNSERFTEAVRAAVVAVPDLQPLSLQLDGGADVGARLGGVPLRLDVLRPAALAVQVTATCTADGRPGLRTVSVSARLRGQPLATGVVLVTCLPSPLLQAPAADVPLAAAALLTAPGAAPGPLPGLPLVPPAPGPPPPPGQTQAQPAPGGQPAAVAQGALQEEEQIALALALQDDAPGQLAVSQNANRTGQQQRALGVLSLSLLATGLGAVLVHRQRRTQAAPARARRG